MMENVGKRTIPCYEFSKECRQDLQEFIKIAEEQKLQNPFCNLSKHCLWSKLLPLDSSLKLNAEAADAVIVLESSDEEEKQTTAKDSNSDCFIIPSQSDNINDFADAITGNLKTDSCLSETVKQDLRKHNAANLKTIFLSLRETLTIEDIRNLAAFLVGDVLIATFCRFLLFPKLKDEHNDLLSSVVRQFSQDYPPVLKNELVSIISAREPCRGLFQSLNSLHKVFKDDFLRTLIFTLETLNDNSVELLLFLIHKDIKSDILIRLVNLQFKVCKEYSKNTAFGKLLMNTIQFLGENGAQVKQPLKHIIDNHTSIWKAKLELELESRCNDSGMLSQMWN